ncbi:hypothetical protein BLNAU_10120 [Blattamonas nauphoetae]|uniref:TM2 domain-containing protein n=1 Tax=Blattamonas nauphoetae TaxID=2049346 RepID=A0ABQ9XU23_9EUKA|nr:hypothetical protein BLNAU_10120 [Blattamonas nauphoetae]
MQTTETPAKEKIKIDWTDKNLFMDVKWPDNIGTTVSDGIPAWGNGQFSKNMACGLAALTLIGLDGIHRFYLGDICCGICLFFTLGGCCIGQLIDCCRMGSMVKERNKKIKSAVKDKIRKRSANAQGQPGMVVIIQQPQPYPPTQVYPAPAQGQAYPQPGYPQQGYPPQGYPPQGYPPQTDPSKSYPPPQQLPSGAYAPPPGGDIAYPAYPQA